jgi:fructokinase
MSMADFPLFVAAGEALTDMIVADAGATRWHSQVGGSTWNVARAMARLGTPAGFAGAISRDVFGDQLWQASQAAGLDLRLLQRVDKSPLLAIVHRLDPPTYFFVGDDSADLHFDAGCLPDGWRGACRWAHFGGISLARRPLADKLVDLAASLKADGVRISYDPNFRAVMDADYDATLRRMTALADVVKVSEEDLAGLFRTGDTDGALATLRGWNPAACYLYTRGAGGAAFYAGEQAWSVPAPRIDVVDTVGAGDASMAALAWSMLHAAERDGLAHLRFAVAAGAAACLAPGATPPGLDTIDALMDQMEAGVALTSSR